MSLKEAIEQKRAVAAQWDDLVSIATIAAVCNRSTKRMKEVLDDADIKPVGRLGSSNLYSKSTVLELIKSSIK